LPGSAAKIEVGYPAIDSFAASLGYLAAIIGLGKAGWKKIAAPQVSFAAPALALGL
jgi:hypothetical protein